ncbi:MAG: hypothetical protein P4K78_11825 [Terracidiphilus sp.]|nr:hypothetical protein [Terracidiphilus sp.]
MPGSQDLARSIGMMEEKPASPGRRGIYLVANRQSEAECNNLIASIRRCGCRLPIRVIPYGGSPAVLDARWNDVEPLSMGDFSAEGLAFLKELQARITQCNPGHLRRFLCWFGEFDEFIYSDNDVVALMNWEELFPYLENHDLVHADYEFTTGGKFNLREPRRFEELMGPGSLEAAFTAGHFLCHKSPKHPADLLAGLAWMEAHRDLLIWQDQTLLHVTLLVAQWRVLNLCRPPHHWASSWAGDYKDVLELVRTIQVERRPISHMHYSGKIGTGARPIDDLLWSNLPAKGRNRKLLGALLRQALGLEAMSRQKSRAQRKIHQFMKKSQ